MKRFFRRVDWSIPNPIRDPDLDHLKDDWFTLALKCFTRSQAWAQENGGRACADTDDPVERTAHVLFAASRLLHILTDDDWKRLDLIRLENYLPAARTFPAVALILLRHPEIEATVQQHSLSNSKSTPMSR